MNTNIDYCRFKPIVISSTLTAGTDPTINAHWYISAMSAASSHMNALLHSLERSVDSICYFLGTQEEPFFEKVKYNITLFDTNHSFDPVYGWMWFDSNTLYYRPEGSKKIYVVPDINNAYTLIQTEMANSYATLDEQSKNRLNKKKVQAKELALHFNGDMYNRLKENESILLRELQTDTVKCSINQTLEPRKQ